MAPSSDVNDTDEDESNKSIMHEPFHKTSSENIYMNLSESECNIVNENLSQNNSSDVLTNVIMELKYDEHIEPSVSIKGAIYFILFKCGRNILYQFNVTYQRAFTASKATSSVPGNRFGSQDQSKVKKIQKGEVCHRKCQHEGSFQQNQRV